MDRGPRRERNVVERLVGRLEEYRPVETRCDKLAASCPAFVQLAAVRMWLRWSSYSFGAAGAKVRGRPSAARRHGPSADGAPPGAVPGRWRGA